MEEIRLKVPSLKKLPRKKVAGSEAEPSLSSSLTWAERAAELADDKKAENIIVLDMRGLTIISDYFVIASGESDTQVKAIADNVLEGLSMANVRPHHVEGRAEGGWILLDYGDLIVHVFHKETRSFYDLESLWGDAPRVK